MGHRHMYLDEAINIIIIINQNINHGISRRLAEGAFDCNDPDVRNNSYWYIWKNLLCQPSWSEVGGPSIHPSEMLQYPASKDGSSRLPRNPNDDATSMGKSDGGHPINNNNYELTDIASSSPGGPMKFTMCAARWGKCYNNLESQKDGKFLNLCPRNG